MQRTRATEDKASRRYTAGLRGLLIDWGGVLTTNLFASFHAYCVRVELDPEILAGRFRKDPEARELLIALEKGEIDEPAFERRFAQLLGVAPDGLIDGLFTDVAPDLPMLDAVRRAHAAGIRTGLVSNSWGVHRYPHELFDELFDGVVISGAGGDPQALAAHVRAGRRARRGAGGGLRLRRRPAFNLAPAKSSAWRPCTTRARRRRSPSSNGCSGCPYRAL